MKHFAARVCTLFAFAAIYLAPNESPGEAMLQYFNTDWNEIADKMPELAEAGYDSIWLPPTSSRRLIFRRILSDLFGSRAELRI